VVERGNGTPVQTPTSSVTPDNPLITIADHIQKRNQAVISIETTLTGNRQYVVCQPRSDHRSRFAAAADASAVICYVITLPTVV
jgi:hypothetical protein